MVLIAWVISQSSGPTQRRLRAISAPRRAGRRLRDGTPLALHVSMMTSNRAIHPRQCAHVAVILTLLVLGASVQGAEAQPSPPGAASVGAGMSTSSGTLLGHMDHAIASSERQARNRLRLEWTLTDPSSPGRRWPLRADPRRWPRLLANTTECTLSFDPVLRRHWWQ